MKETYAKAIVEAANDECVNASVYENYSGRGMYGETTTGVTLEDDGILPVLTARVALRLSSQNHNLDVDEFIEEIRSLRSDNLGRDVIIY